MGRFVVSLLLLALAVAGLAMAARAQQEPPPEPAACSTDRLLVKVRPDADPATVVARYGGTIVETIPGILVQVVTVPAGAGQQAIDALSADPEVQYAEPDGEMRAAAEGSGC